MWGVQGMLKEMYFPAVVDFKAIYLQAYLTQLLDTSKNIKYLVKMHLTYMIKLYTYQYLLSRGIHFQYQFPPCNIFQWQLICLHAGKIMVLYGLHILNSCSRHVLPFQCVIVALKDIVMCYCPKLFFFLSFFLHIQNCKT